MKTLLLDLEIPPVPAEEFKITKSHLRGSNCFDYDLIIVQTGNPEILYGSSSDAEVGQIAARWRKQLPQWFKQGKILIVLLSPFKRYGGLDNYIWLPFDIPIGEFQDVGIGNNIGDITAENILIRDFLESNTFGITTHIEAELREGKGLSLISTNSFTSFQIERNGALILFIPRPENLANLFSLARSVGSITLNFKVEDLVKAEEELAHFVSEESEIRSKKEEAEKKVIEISLRVQNLVNLDIPARKAIALYEKIKLQDKPNPPDFYEVIEHLERAFESEREMRDILRIPKAKIDKVMSRATKFRHVQKEGQEPTPLSDEEISEFKSILQEAIEKYIAYRYSKEQQ